jgi:hypothetical protein
MRQRGDRSNDMIDRYDAATVEKDGVFIDPIYRSDWGPYVEYDDHLAEVTELTRLLKRFDQHVINSDPETIHSLCQLRDEVATALEGR